MNIKIIRSEFKDMCCGCNSVIESEQPVAYVTGISSIRGSLHFCEDCINDLQNDICDEMQKFSDGF